MSRNDNFHLSRSKAKGLYLEAYEAIREEMSRRAEWRTLNDYFMHYGRIGDAAFISFMQRHYEFCGWRRTWKQEHFHNLRRARGFKGNVDYYDRLPF